MNLLSFGEFGREVASNGANVRDKGDFEACYLGFFVKDILVHNFDVQSLKRFQYL